MIVYRIARNEFCDTSGEGAKRYGGRWNRKGVPAVYASGSVSAALLERLTIDPELFSSDRYLLYSVVELDCPDAYIQRFGAEKLPVDWDAIPHQKESEDFGTALLENGVLCFAVPSVVDPTSSNFVINPLSVHFKLIESRVTPLNLDRRIVRGG